VNIRPDLPGKKEYPTIKLIIYEIAMSEYPHQPKMIMWLFHLAIKKQIINR